MIRANGVCLHVSDSGEQHLPVMVFANSLGTDFRSWDRVAAHYSGRFRILRYDMRGHGLSECPDAPYSIEDLVADLDQLLAALGITSAIVVGLSVGGLVAQGLAALRPGLVRAAVLSNTAAKVGSPEMWAQRIATIEAGGIASLSEPILERWFSAAFRQSRPEELSGWRAMLTRTTREGYIGICHALAGADLTASTAKLKLPVLVIAGSEDGSTPPDLVRGTADLIEGSSFTLIEGVGHIPCVEAPEAFCAAVDTFLEEHSLV